MAHWSHAGFVLSDETEFLPTGTNSVLLFGEVECLGGIHIRVAHLFELEGEGADALLHTSSFSYNVSLKGVGNIFRYDSRDSNEQGEPWGHHAYHHKHTYAVLEGDKVGEVDLILDERAVPMLPEILDEAFAWYWEHVHRLEGPGPDP